MMLRRIVALLEMLVRLVQFDGSPHIIFLFFSSSFDAVSTALDVSTNDADTIMISALSSLKAQLLPRLSIGNCCSNFHILLNDFLFEGCGAASFNTFHCIQETEDPLLKVCCGWHRDCQERKKELLLQMNATNITTSESGQD